MLCPTCNRALCSGHTTAAEVAEARRREDERAEAERVKAEEAQARAEAERLAPIIQLGEDSLNAEERGWVRRYIEDKKAEEAKFRQSLKLVHRR